MFLGTLWSSIKQNEAPYLFVWDDGIALLQSMGIGHHHTASGNSHVFSRVAAGTWGIISSNGGDSNLKLDLFQRIQDACLVMTDNSGI